VAGGRDDFGRDAIRWDPPEAPLVVSAPKSGVRGLEDEERDGGPADTTLADLERQMDEPANRALVHHDELDDRERETRPPRRHRPTPQRHSLSVHQTL
jgi:hypothetical protein